MAISLTLIAAILPALMLLYFIYRKDSYRTEPSGQILKAFLFGVLSAPASWLISLPLMAIGVFPETATTVGGHLRTAFFGAGIPEEAAKLFFLWLFIRKCKFFDEWVDGIVYSACIGLGFSAFENIEYLFINYQQWVSLGALRGIVSVPGHFFFAVTMGYFYSKACFGDATKRKLNYALAFVIPMLLHGAFDSCLMLSQIAEIAASMLSLFIGLYIFMAVKSRKFFLAHRAADGDSMLHQP